eukprot:1286158-Prymnesium_polylepis.1
MTVTPVVCSARTRRTVSPRPPAPLTPGMPRRWLATRTVARRPAHCPHHRTPPGLSSQRVLRPDRVTTPGCP